MSRKKSKKKKKVQKPRVNKELEGFDIKIDTFGEIKTNYDINKLNEFLNREVDDKKLRHLRSGEHEDDKDPPSETPDEEEDANNPTDEQE